MQLYQPLRAANKPPAEPAVLIGVPSGSLNLILWLN